MKSTPVKIPGDSSIIPDIGIDGRFVLMIGTLNPRKNIVNAIRAFDAMSDAGGDLQLVIVGNLQGHGDRLAATRPRVKFTGFISDVKLSALYKKASILLFPSYYEGFGFPVLEAMSAGLPVVTSNNSSIPEISGYKAELLCNPADHHDISRLMKRFLEDANRVDLVEHGYRNIKRFSWERMINETITVYNEV